MSLGCWELHPMNAFSFSAGEVEMVTLQFYSGPIMRC